MNHLHTPEQIAAEIWGVSEPTFRNLLDPMSKPWPKTLAKLSNGLSRLGY